MHRNHLAARLLILVMTVALLALTAGCNKGAKLIEQATQQQSAGELDQALATLAQVKTAAPDTPEVDQAKELAVGWLIEAADKESKPEDKQKRLEAALGWDPSSGKAQARLCAIYLEGKALAKLRQCLGEGLAKTTGAPEGEVDRLRDGLQALEEAEDQARLMQPGNIEKLETLVAKYPDSQTARTARKLLISLRSLCGDVDQDLSYIDKVLAVTDQLQEGLKLCLDKPSTAATIACFHILADELDNKLVPQLRRAIGKIQKHKLLPGEGEIRDGLVTDFQTLAAAATRWSKALRMVDVTPELEIVGNQDAAMAALTQAKTQAEDEVMAIIDHQRVREQKCQRIKANAVAAAEAAGELDGPPDGKPPAPQASAAPVASAAPSWQSNTRIRRTDGATMVLVPAGPFVRGSAANEGEDDEHPQQQITLETFWIDKLEVTVGQYKKCVEAKGCTAPAWGQNCNYAAKDRDDHPINCVIWSEADSYCKWAGARLPTEAEWEKASRGPDGRKYPWGDQPPSCSLAILPESGKRGCGTNMTWPVGSKPEGASPYGALDMAGNVWEWCSDYYDETYYSRSPTEDPTGPEKGSPRVNRGGGWEAHDTLHLRGANRYKFAPSFRFHALGMRCAASAD